MDWVDLVIMFIVENAAGGLILLAVGADEYGLRLLNPTFIYQNVEVNYFGCFILTLILNLLCPIATICYWFYKLCTVGRKK